MRYWQKLSPFFHFLYEQNLTKQDFSKLIQKCIIPQPHPTTYSIEEIRRLESSFDLSVKDSYLLDNKSPVCPYIDFHNGKECIKFKPLRTISKNA